MSLACALIFPFAFFRGGRSSARGRTARILWSGALQIGINYACIFLAEERIESGLSAVLFATFPLFVALFAHAMLPDEPLTVRIAVSAGLGLVGVAVIEAPALRMLFSAPDWPRLEGSGLVLVASVVAAYSNVYNKKYLKGVAPDWNTWLQTLSGSALLLLLAVTFEPAARLVWTPRSAFALVYLAVLGTALPFAGLFWLLGRVPVAVIGTIPIVDTVIAVALGALILGEAFSPRVLFGAALILVAVLLATLPDRRRASATLSESRSGSTSASGSPTP
jgi:drug/metabolite transporter (DMT)-like permease